MNSLAELSPWWSEGLRFSCIGCGRCCRGEPGAIYFTEGEEEKICDHLKISKERFRAEYVTHRWGDPSIGEKANGECLFYDPATARCAIYQVRPTQCRTWPFWEDILESPDQWAWASRRCPGIDEGRLWTESEIRSILEDQL
ncbi:YkgJ family cysteine cluster protein [Dethiosulfovibrio salsuginis]|uniref:YkgJ family cysteine cluster protein n=1 Tax=Dethiosulfovibrio salsuginis TaxID=561720 RepID=UPI000A1CCE8A|nr:YkgJ family cysteine cluster protein [Dethiosulfovibrio salsuginis]